MSYNHAFYAPFRIGDRVSSTEGPTMGKVGSVTRRDPEEGFIAERMTYFVTFDGETEECKEAFSYWELALA